MTTRNTLRQWFWPKIADHNSAEKAILQGVWAASIVACLYIVKAFGHISGRFYYEDMWFLHDTFFVFMFFFIAFRIKQKSIPIVIVGLGILFYDLLISVGTIEKVVSYAITEKLDSNVEENFIYYTPHFWRALLFSMIIALPLISSLRGMCGNYRFVVSPPVASKSDPSFGKGIIASLFSAFFFCLVYLMVIGAIYLIVRSSMGPKTYNVALGIIGLVAVIVCSLALGKKIALAFQSNHFSKNLIVQIVVSAFLFLFILGGNFWAMDVEGVFSRSEEKKPDVVTFSKTPGGHDLITIRGR